MAVAATVSAAACAAGSDPAARRAGEVVYGTDDRLEAFELTDPGARALVSGAMVALVSNAVIEATGGRLAGAPTWGQAAGLCPGEPFADQPAAAFCTGVLVDWDLVLTADHCTRLFAVQDFQAVFDYEYVQPGVLTAQPGDAVAIRDIVREELDPEGSQPRLDYAWLRLAHPVAPPRRPVALYAAPPLLETGQRLISVGAGGGVPMKWDAGGQVRDARSAWLDYFTADADNSGGSSGGGAFDERLVLVGIAARGEADFAPSAAGCNTTVREPAGGGTGEDFTYAFQALRGLCDGPGRTSTLCRADCGSPCQALPPEAGSAAGGCAVAPTARGPRAPASLIGALASLRWFRRRVARSGGPRVLKG
jgi:hypothetical protein